MPDTPKRAAIYAKTATPQENSYIFALTDQIHQCREYCGQKGYTLLYVYAEVGSGSTHERKALINALADAKEGKFDILLIHTFSRLARNGDLLQHIICQFEEAGVKVESVTEQADLETLIPVLFEEVRKMQRERISLRIRAGRKEQLAKGGLIP